jgi:IMP dehydrogenase/GMP reductase
MKQKFDFKDITIIPESVSSIRSRSEVSILNQYGELPIMVSPMDTVVDIKNYKTYLNQQIPVCLPRGEDIVDDAFYSVSLDEFEDIVNSCMDEGVNMKFKILVDIANGHIKKLHDLCKKFIDKRDESLHTLMVGNIANPKTYKQLSKIGVDYVRVGIGGGSGCLTSANTGIHYPMASLIHECYQIKKDEGYKTKIVADGGFQNYDDIIKALALGADYVMLGGVLNKCLESCGQTKLFNKINLTQSQSEYLWVNTPRFRKYMYKSFRGMSTKDVQKKWNKGVLKTSEGISKSNKIEYTLEQWVTNFKDYLKSAMSYTNSLTLESFKDSEFVFITENALKRFNK